MLYIIRNMVFLFAAVVCLSIIFRALDTNAGEEISTQMVDKLLSSVQEEKNRKEFENIKQNIETNSVKHQALAKSIVETVQENISSIANLLLGNSQNIDSKENKDRRDFLVDGLTNTNSTKLTSCNRNEDKNELLIFVSFSMPKQLLIDLDLVAKKIGAKLIIRGLINNSFKETVKYITSLQKGAIAVNINPNLFRQYDIKQVPSFVLKESKNGNIHDKLTGNVTIDYALELFEREGEASLKDRAHLYKSRISKL